MQFFKRRCSCGTRGPGQDISHECFKRNCGSNPTAGLNHLRAFARHFTPANPDHLFLLALGAREQSFRRFLCRLSSLLLLSSLTPRSFHLFTLAFVLAPFFSLAGYHIVPLVPSLLLFLSRAFPSPLLFSSLLLARCFVTFFTLPPVRTRHDSGFPLRESTSNHITIEQHSYGGPRAAVLNSHL